MKITVVTDNLVHIKANIEKLVKRANKLQVAPPIVTYSEERLFYVGENKYLSLTDVEIINPVIKLNDEWELAATIERYEAGNMVNCVPSLSDRLPTDLRTKEINICDHCQTKRRRNKYIVVSNSNTNELKIVGSTCVKDFLGHDAVIIVKYLANIIKVCNDMTEYEYDSWGTDYSNYHQVSITEVINATLAILDISEFVGSKSTGDYKIATYQEVIEQTFNYHKLKAEHRIEITAKHEELGRKIMDRWLNKSENIDSITCSDLDWKRHLLTTKGTIASFEMSLAVGLVYGETIAIAKELEAESKPTIFFGTEKKREQFELKITFVKAVENDYGTTKLVKGIDTQSGGIFVWWDSTCNDWYQTGETYKVKATVKKHDNNPRFGSQTTINRVALIR